MARQPKPRNGSGATTPMKRGPQARRVSSTSHNSQYNTNTQPSTTSSSEVESDNDETMDSSAWHTDDADYDEDMNDYEFSDHDEDDEDQPLSSDDVQSNNSITNTHSIPSNTTPWALPWIFLVAILSAFFFIEMGFPGVITPPPIEQLPDGSFGGLIFHLPIHTLPQQNAYFYSTPLTQSDNDDNTNSLHHQPTNTTQYYDSSTHRSSIEHVSSSITQHASILSPTYYPSVYPSFDHELLRTYFGPSQTSIPPDKSTISPVILSSLLRTLHISLAISPSISSSVPPSSPLPHYTYISTPWDKDTQTIISQLMLQIVQRPTHTRASHPVPPTLPPPPKPVIVVLDASSTLTLYRDISLFLHDISFFPPARTPTLGTLFISLVSQCNPHINHTTYTYVSQSYYSCYIILKNTSLETIQYIDSLYLTTVYQSTALSHTYTSTVHQASLYASQRIESMKSSQSSQTPPPQYHSNPAQYYKDFVIDALHSEHTLSQIAPYTLPYLQQNSIAWIVFPDKVLSTKLHTDNIYQPSPSSHKPSSTSSSSIPPPSVPPSCFTPQHDKIITLPRPSASALSYSLLQRFLAMCPNDPLHTTDNINTTSDIGSQLYTDLQNVDNMIASSDDPYTSLINIIQQTPVLSTSLSIALLSQFISTSDDPETILYYQHIQQQQHKADLCNLNQLTKNVVYSQVALQQLQTPQFDEQERRIPDQILLEPSFFTDNTLLCSIFPPLLYHPQSQRDKYPTSCQELAKYALQAVENKENMKKGNNTATTTATTATTTTTTTTTTNNNRIETYISPTMLPVLLSLLLIDSIKTDPISNNHIKHITSLLYNDTIHDMIQIHFTTASTTPYDSCSKHKHSSNTALSLYCTLYMSLSSTHKHYARSVITPSSLLDNIHAYPTLFTSHAYSNGHIGESHLSITPLGSIILSEYIKYVPLIQNIAYIFQQRLIAVTSQHTSLPFASPIVFPVPNSLTYELNTLISTHLPHDNVGPDTIESLRHHSINLLSSNIDAVMTQIDIQQDNTINNNNTTSLYTSNTLDIPLLEHHVIETAYMIRSVVIDSAIKGYADHAPTTIQRDLYTDSSTLHAYQTNPSLVSSRSLMLINALQHTISKQYSYEKYNNGIFIKDRYNNNNNNSNISSSSSSSSTSTSTSISSIIASQQLCREYLYIIQDYHLASIHCQRTHILAWKRLVCQTNTPSSQSSSLLSFPSSVKQWCHELSLTSLPDYTHLSFDLTPFVSWPDASTFIIQQTTQYPQSSSLHLVLVTSIDYINALRHKLIIQYHDVILTTNKISTSSSPSSLGGTTNTLNKQQQPHHKIIKDLYMIQYNHTMDNIIDPLLTLVLDISDIYHNNTKNTSGTTSTTTAGTTNTATTIPIPLSHSLLGRIMYMTSKLFYLRGNIITPYDTTRTHISTTLNTHVSAATWALFQSHYRRNLMSNVQFDPLQTRLISFVNTMISPNALYYSIPSIQMLSSSGLQPDTFRAVHLWTVGQSSDTPYSCQLYFDMIYNMLKEGKNTEGLRYFDRASSCFKMHIKNNLIDIRNTPIGLWRRYIIQPLSNLFGSVSIITPPQQQDKTNNSSLTTTSHHNNTTIILNDPIYTLGSLYIQSLTQQHTLHHIAQYIYDHHDIDKMHHMILNRYYTQQTTLILDFEARVMFAYYAAYHANNNNNTTHQHGRKPHHHHHHQKQQQHHSARVPDVGPTITALKHAVPRYKSEFGVCTQQFALLSLPTTIISPPYIDSDNEISLATSFSCRYGPSHPITIAYETILRTLLTSVSHRPPHH